MTTYTLFTLVVTGVLLPLSVYVLPNAHRGNGIRVAMRSALFVTLMTYPWDFFAVKQGVWRYPQDPGLTLYGVPLNDLLMIWVCTQFSTSLIYAQSQRKDSGEGHPESEDTDE